MQELLQMKGINLFCNIRKGQRGGGTAVAVCSKSFHVSNINVNIPKGLEVSIVKITSKSSDNISP